MHILNAFAVFCRLGFNKLKTPDEFFVCSFQRDKLKHEGLIHTFFVLLLRSLSWFGIVGIMNGMQQGIFVC